MFEGMRLIFAIKLWRHMARPYLTTGRGDASEINFKSIDNERKKQQVQEMMKEHLYAFAIVEVAGKDDITAAIELKHESLKIVKYDKKVL